MKFASLNFVLIILTSEQASLLYDDTLFYFSDWKIRFQRFVDRGIINSILPEWNRSHETSEIVRACKNFQIPTVFLRDPIQWYKKWIFDWSRGKQSLRRRVLFCRLSSRDIRGVVEFDLLFIFFPRFQDVSFFKQYIVVWRTKRELVSAFSHTAAVHRGNFHKFE